MTRSWESLAAVTTGRLAWPRSAPNPWIVALVASKASDLATTMVGLLVADGLAERNPLAGVVFEHFGVVGLCALSAAVLVSVVLVVEHGAAVLEAHDETAMGADTVYRLGYLPLTLLFSSVAVYNSVLLCIRV